MSDEKGPILKRFGRYLLLDHLVDGGMAKICRARFISEQADKIVAIKMIQPQYSRDENFKKMFLDEIKVTFGLIHPNIAQTYDSGVLDSQLFTAMEYCDGKNLKQYLVRLKEKKFVFPVEISIYIISQVCLGLNYAHNFTNKLTGKNGNIIHRDISPHNIMLTYDGAIKIIDFGIAKAETNSESTKAGTIKGKLSYLAPEYLEGQDLDHRYDQFAVGITLWELLCCRKLFVAKNELSILKLIQECKVPAPSKINPNVPPELDEIVLKALSKDRSKRFANMDEFNRALVRTLYAKYPEFNASDLSYFAKELFKEEIQSDRAKLIEYGKIDIQPFLEQLKVEQKDGGGTNTHSHSHGNTKSVVRDEARVEIDLGFKGEGEVEDAQTKKEKFNQRRKAQQFATSAVKGGTKADTVRGKSIREMKRGQVSSGPDVKGSSSKSKKGGDSSSLGSLIALFVVFGILGVLLKDQVINLCIQNGICPKGDQNIQKERTVKNYGFLRLTGFDQLEMKVFVDNKLVEYIGLPMKIEIKPNGSVITVRKDGHRDFEKLVKFEENEKSITVRIPELDRVSEGFLYTSRSYRPGTIMELDVDGRERSIDLPVDNFRLPAGQYRATIKNEFLGTERNVKFEIIEDQRTLLPTE